MRWSPAAYDASLQCDECFGAFFQEDLDDAGLCPECSWEAEQDVNVTALDSVLTALEAELVEFEADDELSRELNERLDSYDAAIDRRDHDALVAMVEADLAEYKIGAAGRIARPSNMHTENERVLASMIAR